MTLERRDFTLNKAAPLQTDSSLTFPDKSVVVCS